MSTSKGMIAWYVNQNVHVSTSNKKLLRIFWDKLKAHPQNMTMAAKAERKEVYRIALAEHEENRQLVRDWRF
jgi:hypothetical protein